MTAPAIAAPSDVSRLAEGIRACRLCRTAPHKAFLPHEPRPIARLSATARLAIASQAPGARAHASGIPFDDPSGKRLRAWMGIAEPVFHDPDKVVIVPMGFCFPGHDAAKGDLPPRPECRPAWHDDVFDAMPQIETILAIGLHAIGYHLARLHPGLSQGLGLTDLVGSWRTLFDGPVRPRLISLPHPSWRNSAWLKRNPWFETDVLPVVRREVERLTA